MVTIPYLFVDQEQVISTGNWYQYLKENASSYEKCYVKSVTHVKNLDSDVSHEYLQIIIEHGLTSFRTRIIAERQQHQDQVIIGRWKASKYPRSSGFSRLPDSFNSGSSSSSGSISGGKPSDLPLPLASLKFDGTRMFGVCDLALILYQVTQKDPKYSLLNHNCYWFSYEAYAIMKARRPAPFERCWKYSWVAGKPIVLKKKYKPEAREFEGNRESEMLYIPSKDGSPDPDLGRGLSREVQSHVFQEWVGDEWEVPTSLPPSSEKDTTVVREQFDLSINEWCKGVLASQSCDKDIETYNAITNQGEESNLPLFDSPREAVDLDDVEVIRPSAERVALLDRALKARIGSVLAALPPEYSNAKPIDEERDACAILPGLADSFQGPDDAGRLAVAIEWKWEVGRTLRIRFMNGSKEMHEKAKRYIKLWEEHVNLKFEFVDEGDAEIRIGFNRGAGTWSILGNKSLDYAQDSLTMNFGCLSERTPESEFQGTVLHEFGHALGCIHEHQSPAANIQWKKTAIYDYYRRTFSWSENDVNVNILDRYDPSKIRNSSLDLDSIMLYAINPDHTENGVSAERKNELSARDKDFIAGLYPRRSADDLDPNDLDERGGFPLYWACAGGHYNQAKNLLRQGALPNRRSRYDWTALHWAAGNGFSDIVRLLLDHNATVDVRSDTGMTPLDLTRDSRIREALEEHAQLQRQSMGGGEQGTNVTHSYANPLPPSVEVGA